MRRDEQALRENRITSSCCGMATGFALGVCCQTRDEKGELVDRGVDHGTVQRLYIFACEVVLIDLHVNGVNIYTTKRQLNHIKNSKESQK